ncbi:MAG: hypothetical protein ACK4ST_02635, partial [Elioraea tepidiphila]
TDTSRFSFDALRKGGKLIQVGLFGGEMNIPLPLVPIRALTIQGSYVGNVKDLRELVAIAQSGRLPAIPITNMPLNQADAALNRLKDGKVVEQGPAEAVMDAPQQPYTRALMAAAFELKADESGIVRR